MSNAETDFPSLKPPGTTAKITSIFDFNAESLGELMAYIAQNPPPIPITQIIGFAQFAAQLQRVVAQNNTTSPTYVNLATPGPTISGLPAGRYLLVYGAAAANSGAPSSGSLMSPSINGAAPSDNDTAQSGVVSLVSVVGATLATLPLDSNTVTLQYKVSGGQGDYAKRWLITLKYGN